MKHIQSVAAALAALVALSAGSASAESPRARMFADAQAAGDRAAVAQIERDGAFSATTVSQIAGANTARQYARGARSSGNSGAVVQNGANNGAYVRQVGSGLDVGIVQNNNNNRAYVLQMGHDLGLGVTQNGGARTVVVQTQDRIVARDVR